VHLPLISLKNKVNFSVSDTGLTGNGQKDVYRGKNYSLMPRAMVLQSPGFKVTVFLGDITLVRF
jgi:hypothetical protein